MQQCTIIIMQRFIFIIHQCQKTDNNREERGERSVYQTIIFYLFKFSQILLKFLKLIINLKIFHKLLHYIIYFTRFSSVISYSIVKYANHSRKDAYSLSSPMWMRTYVPCLLSTESRTDAIRLTANSVPPCELVSYWEKYPIHTKTTETGKSPSVYYENTCYTTLPLTMYLMFEFLVASSIRSGAISHWRQCRRASRSIWIWW